MIDGAANAPIDLREEAAAEVKQEEEKIENVPNKRIKKDYIRQKPVPLCKNLQMKHCDLHPCFPHILSSRVKLWDTLVRDDVGDILAFSPVQLRNWAEASKGMRFYFVALAEHTLKKAQPRAKECTYLKTLMYVYQNILSSYL